MSHRPPPSPTHAPPAPANRELSEAAIERLVLNEIGQDPDILLYKNEVGAGFPMGVRDKVLAALPACFRAEIAAIFREWSTSWGEKGSPDLEGAVAGRWFGLELKRPGIRPEPHQLAWHARARSVGAFVEVIHSAEEARAAIDLLRGGPPSRREKRVTGAVLVAADERARAGGGR